MKEWSSPFFCRHYYQLPEDKGSSTSPILNIQSLLLRLVLNNEAMKSDLLSVLLLQRRLESMSVGKKRPLQ